MKLEICANSIQSALNAQKAGADRIELCSALELGGLTPSYGSIKKAVNLIKIPINVLIRPRAGNFCYSSEEFDIMKSAIIKCKELGVHGIVSGILKDDNTLDIERTKELVELTKPLLFTFHRAFDIALNPEESLDHLIKLKVDTLLTSGQQPKAVDGLQLLIKLKNLSNNQIEIMPGSGINHKNIEKFFSNGFGYAHASAAKPLLKAKQSLIEHKFLKESNTIEIKKMIAEINK